MHYFLYRYADDLGRPGWRLEKFQFSDTLTARAMIEQRHDDTVLRLWRLPGPASGLIDLMIGLTRRPVPTEVLAEFLHNLGVMLRCGLPIDQALVELREENRRSPMARVINELHIGVSGGSALSAVMERHREIIPGTVLSLIAIGEQSGNLDRVLLDGAAHINRVRGIRQDVQKALIYPVFVTLVVLLAALFWIDYVLPNIQQMFLQMNAHLPPLTIKAMAVAGWLQRLIEDWFWALLAGLTLAILLVTRTTWLRQRLYALLWRLPISGRLIRDSALAFMTEYLSLLIRAGVNLSEALAVLEEAMRNPHYRGHLQRVREGIRNGSRLSDELQATGVFPRLMIRLVSVGEQSGNLDEQLDYLAVEYRRRLHHTVDSLAEILKPLMISIAGVFFIFVVAVFLLPVYQLISQTTMY
ncbi:type II secretion system F family protein [Marichromatium gracile]|uniref:type II secretion system F family protein n=1 Tax=Marichromatium gracile TaxID=1048 RepID=UPI001F46A63F|nr:type II secretion system F family protein [Marichromatium gracile]MCF1182856.1 type II secretion system F family protein [Marichromatium gracile]